MWSRPEYEESEARYSDERGDPKRRLVRALRSERRRLSQGTIELMTLDRPERLNAIDTELLDALALRIAEIGREPEIRAVILTGAGKRAFSAGADISEFRELSPIAADALMGYGHSVFGALERLAQPTIAAINGYALGGGLELALACDFRLAAASAQLGQPEIKLASIPGWGGTQRLPRVVGESVAKDLILTGRLITAQEAADLHLVHRVYEDGILLDAALTFADDLAAKSATALGLAKRALHARLGQGELGYDIERQAVGLCFTTVEQRLAVEAFGTQPQEGPAASSGNTSPRR